MTFDDPGDDIFGHLDDPTPPLYGGEAMTNVMQRGQQIRRRRRSVYGASTAAVFVAIAGVVIAISGSNGSGTDNRITPLHSKTPTSQVSSPPTKHHHNSSGGTTPNGSTSAGPGGGTHPGKHHHSPPPVTGTTAPTPCNSSTPTASPTDTPTTTPTDTPTDSGPPDSNALTGADGTTSTTTDPCPSAPVASGSPSDAG